MKKFLILGGVVLTVFLSLHLFPGISLGAGEYVSGAICDPLNKEFDPGCVDMGSDTKVMNLFMRFLIIFRTLFWVFAVAMILYAAFLYLTGGVSDANIKKAKNALWYAIIGMALALVSTSIPFLIKSIIR